MAAFGIHELRKQTAEEYPDASYDDVFGRTRDKVVSAVKDANIPERVGEQASKLRLPERRPTAEGGGDGATETMPVSAEEERLARLERLGTMREKGILTEEEFSLEKARLLSGDPS
jgi:hypothetical protein